MCVFHAMSPLWVVQDLRTFYPNKRLQSSQTIQNIRRCNKKAYLVINIHYPSYFSVITWCNTITYSYGFLWSNSQRTDLSSVQCLLSYCFYVRRPIVYCSVDMVAPQWNHFSNTKPSKSVSNVIELRCSVDHGVYVESYCLAFKQI